MRKYICPLSHYLEISINNMENKYSSIEKKAPGIYPLNLVVFYYQSKLYGQA